jgi:hypothetical protein
MERIKIKKVYLSVNGNTTIFYELPTGEQCESPFTVLRKLFNKHKDLYGYLGVSSQLAEWAGWHPEDSDFSLSCDGFKKFLADGGKITIQEEKTEITVQDILNELFEQFEKEYWRK